MRRRLARAYLVPGRSSLPVIFLRIFAGGPGFRGGKGARVFSLCFFRRCECGQKPLGSLGIPGPFVASWNHAKCRMPEFPVPRPVVFAPFANARTAPNRAELPHF